MEKLTKKYWKGFEELYNTPEYQESKQREFAEDLPVEALVEEINKNTVTPRRDFLKMIGFGVGTATLAACNRAPVRKAVPYLVKPEGVTPGVPDYYASALPDGYGILVKTHEGRPIKIEGNPACPIAKGGVDAVGHASLLTLYDNGRLKEPVMNEQEASWDDVDNVVVSQMNSLNSEGKNAVILSSTIISPSTKALIAQFIQKYPNTEHVVYEPVSHSAIIKANQNSFGKAVLPSYRFDQASVILSLGADFLGTWISPVEFSKQYVSRRNVKSIREEGVMSRHIHIESGLSMTGTNADIRIPLKPSQHGTAALALYNEIAKRAGAAGLQAGELPQTATKKITEAAEALWEAKGSALVVCGVNDIAVQTVVNAINSLLGSYGTTIDLDNPHFTHQGDEAAFAALLDRMGRKEIGAVFFHGVNPAYDYPEAGKFIEALKNVRMKVSFSDRVDETAAHCNILAPDHNPFESWNDYQPRPSAYYVAQPTINPLFNTRQMQQSLLAWMLNPMRWEDYIQDHWEANILPAAGGEGTDAAHNWTLLLQKGVAVLPVTAGAAAYTFSQDLSSPARAIIQAAASLKGEFELSLYEKPAMRDGRHANNPWLQELPDPVSKVTWDNYAAISPQTALELGVKQWDVVELKSASYSVQLPVLIQPGQAAGTVSVALGYGRTHCGKAGNNVGKNAYPFVNLSNGAFRYAAGVSVTPTGDIYELAQTQMHHSVEGRDTVRETTFAQYSEDHNAGSNPNHNHDKLKEGEDPNNPYYSLWDEHSKPGHHWGMAIDLNSCTGCGACVVSCSMENNVPVVGKDEVRRRREMHWIRIDRYYAVDEEDPENIEVVHQPMLCQHCDHAPCETVCPVLATMHSSDGLNQQAYNRCFGTRYCANNCPYKVRRFNWFNYANNDAFDYYMNNDLGKLALNPDVVVRSRGVMEKCTFCVQRIQAGKLEAKMEKRPLKDGDIETACSTSCPADAITFGDINDPESRVSQLLKDDRVYYALAEYNVQPGIGYMTLVRNKTKAAHAEEGHGHDHDKKKENQHQENIYKDLLRLG
ncbi:quinol:cytochrome c oxidoreductase iron-sulfur protein precursor [Anseongella ginsenosidimutans]|uniref:Quinol:cytochrome c oxidoreductase iron-sulfur protein n=1 Tax=Anseongella ginsenosidimutans TaxID=496056 RepID=A0A4R3KZF7_9SPHI|nr:TAT-variant-translocated molybdopterin oxidoreductase [Anseongella ginsenosidimutans]QEC51298.1 4Fe-4S dicluster domain-containing protein [Anseongella ginsenosidimutans]TCS90010.1 quinol:cytochrome c oxidoreductase iron-sulfur protein precursor [Anseongella ginsenosidimutans]